jgi:hypothetical protein
MNCPKCQQRLLAAEKPEFPSLDVQAHLAECQACRDFQRQLVFIEGNVARVPVPASNGKEQLLRSILQQPVARTPVPRAAAVGRPLEAAAGGAPGGPHAGWWARRESRTALAVGVAASVLIACGIWVGNWLLNAVPESGREQAPQQVKSTENKTPAAKSSAGPKTIQDPFKKDDSKLPAFVDGPTLMAKLVDCDLKLAAPESKRERVEALVEMAEALRHETQLLAKAKSTGPGDAVKMLAKLYQKVVNDGVLPHAQDLPVEERDEMLKSLAERLAKAERDGQKLAKQVAAPALEQRAQQLERDQEMIQTLVKGGLDLAGEEDALRRADYCNLIASGLAKEIKKAVAKKDAVQAALYGRHMQDMLVQGVAVNLTTAREALLPNSPGHEAIAKVGEKVADVAKSVEVEVERAADPENMQPALQAIADGKKQVDLAIKGKDKGKGKGKGKGQSSKKG